MLPHFSQGPHVESGFFDSTCTGFCFRRELKVDGSWDLCCLQRLWRETRVVVTVMVVMMAVNNHHNLRLRRNRDCGEAEDKNQSEH